MARVQAGQVRVLLVEDDEIDSASVVRRLRRSAMKFDVEQASTLEQAREWLKGHRCDLAIIDHDLGDGISGLELLPDLGEVPVLMLTGRGSEMLAVDALRKRVDDYIVKETTGDHLDKLMASIERVLGRRWGALRSYVQELEREIERREQAESALNHLNQDLERLVEEKTRALGGKNRLLEGTLDSMVEGLLAVDAGGRPIHCNARAEAILGQVPANLTSAQGPIEGSSWHEVSAYLSRAVGGELVEVSRLLIDGEASPPRWVSITAVPLKDDEGAREGAVIVIRDITAAVEAEEKQAQLEAQMLQSRKLESLGLLAGGVAHDFNHLLAGIMSNAECLLDEQPKSQMMLDCLADIVTASKRAASLCHQLLAYAGRGRTVNEVFDLNLLIQEMLHLLQSAISKDASVQCVLAPDLPPLEGDATQLRQVVMNLIANASDALGPAGGAITITTDRVHLRPSSAEGYLLSEDLVEGSYNVLKITDVGCGMGEETRTLMFDPFYTTKTKGRGLGLSAVLGIVHSHRGTIKVDSEEGKGTTIEICLPSSKRPLESAEEIELPEGPWRGRGSVLLVDDEVLVRTVATRLLNKCGFHVVTANDGQEAIEIFKIHRNHLRMALIDITMPKLDGVGVLNQLRALNSALPVILSSGYNEHHVAHELVEQSNVYFLQKPYERSKLLTLIRLALKEPGGKAPGRERLSPTGL